MGELARHVINAEFSPWVDRKTGECIRSKETLLQIENDSGDIIYHLFKLAIAYNIDLADVFEKAITNTKNKYGTNLRKTFLRMIF